jgi:ADP-ribose pyrophosphatase YjhB (NUDIX family)
MPKRSNRIELIARGVIREGLWVLLCRNRKKGYFYLPGGHVEFGEAASTALTRELKEEAGLRCKIGSLLVVEEGTFQVGGVAHHELNLVFHVQHRIDRLGARRGSPIEIESLERNIAFEWIGFDQLERTDLRPASLKAWLVRHLKSHHVPRETPPWMSSI